MSRDRMSMQIDIKNMSIFNNAKQKKHSKFMKFYETQEDLI